MLNKLLRTPILRLRCSAYLRTLADLAAFIDANSARSLRFFSTSYF